MARCVHRVNSQNAKKLLLSAVLILVLYLINKGFHAVSQRLLAKRKSVRITFWSDQAIHLAIAILLVVGIVSIWFSDPAIWVRGRQYTGRIVTITNDKIFDEPVYNYSREFPYLWEELVFPVPYTADRKRPEEILIEVAHAHTMDLKQLGEEAIRELERRYFTRRSEWGRASTTASRTIGSRCRCVSSSAIQACAK